MSGSVPDDSRSGVDTLLEALSVRRYARIGFGIGIAVAAVVFVVFVVLPRADRSTALFLALGAVLALSLGLLVTGILVLAEAVRLIRDPDRLTDR